MYGDSAVMRRRAAELRDQAAELRVISDQLITQLDAIGWSGRAATSMRTRLQQRRSELRDVAARHDAAAESMVKHAAEVDLLKEQIAEVEKDHEVALAEARTRVARLHNAEEGVRVDPTDDDATLLAFEAPPAGHKAWLEVDLPGVSQ
ncbi:MAG: hypothetical protein V9G04_00130 [Nocardioides sp.]|jgi:seryl-tRNA synthetase